jgi:hypothetical protein
MLNAQENNKQHAFMKTEKWNLDKLLADIKKKNVLIFFLDASSASNSATPQVLHVLTGTFRYDMMNVFLRDLQ